MVLRVGYVILRCIKFFEDSIITLDSEQDIPIGYNLWFTTVEKGNKEKAGLSIR